MSTPKRFHKRTVVISGASRGIGAAIAHEFAKEGASLVLGYQNDSAAQKETDQTLKAITKDVYWIKGDSAQEDTAVKLCQSAVAKFGSLDCVVANAGILHFAPFAQIKEAELNRLIDVNQKGVYFLLKSAGSIMKKQKKGAVVTISSSAASKTSRMYALYAGTKSFVETLTKGFALEYAPFGIRANVVAAGVTDTEMNRVVLAAAGDSVTNGIPLGRIAQPVDIAQVVTYVCSEDASFITGQVIHADGGLTQG